MTPSVTVHDRRLWLLTLAIVACGIVLRIQQFLLARSLWIDEAMLARGLAFPDASLSAVLPYGQVAPPGFLVVARMSATLAGAGELPLRAPALAAGCVALVACVLLARRLGGAAGALAVALIVGFAPAAVYYSQEFKPYAFDLMFAGLIPLLVLRANDRESGVGRWTAVTVACGLGPLFSTSAIMVVCGAVVPVALGTGRRRDWRRLSWWCAAVGAGVFACATAYWTSYRVAMGSDVMREFWRAAFLGVSSLEGLARSAELVRRVIWGVLMGPPPGAMWWTATVSQMSIAFSGLALLVVGMLVVGAFRLQRERRYTEMAVLLGPLVALTGASLTGQYPMAARLCLFALAPASVLAVIGIVGTRRRAAPTAVQTLGFGGASILVILAMPLDLRWRLSDAQWSSANELIAEAIRSRLPIYVNARGIPQLLHYGTWPPGDEARMRAALYQVSRYGGTAFENKPECTAVDVDMSIGPEPGATLVVGGPTGMQFSYMAGWNRREPCPGWADDEARRIEAVGGDVLLLFLHHIDRAAVVLQATLRERGATCTPIMRNYAELLVNCQVGVAMGYDVDL